MPYEIKVQRTEWTTVSVSTPLEQLVDMIVALGPDNLIRSNVRAGLNQSGKYSFSNGCKMIEVKYVSDFKGQ